MGGWQSSSCHRRASWSTSRTLTAFGTQWKWTAVPRKGGPGRKESPWPSWWTAAPPVRRRFYPEHLKTTAGPWWSETSNVRQGPRTDNRRALGRLGPGDHSREVPDSERDPPKNPGTYKIVLLCLARIWPPLP